VTLSNAEDVIELELIPGRPPRNSDTISGVVIAVGRTRRRRRSACRSPTPVQKAVFAASGRGEGRAHELVRIARTPGVRTGRRRPVSTTRGASARSASSSAARLADPPDPDALGGSRPARVRQQCSTSSSPRLRRRRCGASRRAATTAILAVDERNAVAGEDGRGLAASELVGAPIG
jgi:hypothetical protein